MFRKIVVGALFGLVFSTTPMRADDILSMLGFGSGYKPTEVEIGRALERVILNIDSVGRFTQEEKNEQKAKVRQFVKEYLRHAPAMEQERK